jgi:LysM repeat protein
LKGQWWCAVAASAGLAAALALGCAGDGPSPPESTIHVVKRGETIYGISRRYRVSVEEIVRANDIADVSAVEIGTRLVIPGARLSARDDPADAGLPFFSPDLREQAMREASLAFDWPIAGSTVMTGSTSPRAPARPCAPPRRAA